MIHFDNNIVSERTGKKIPLQERSDVPRNCAEWKRLNRKYYHYKDCSTEIYFDDEHISKNGKAYTARQRDQ
jgi:hypothetical protein